MLLCLCGTGDGVGRGVSLETCCVCELTLGIMYMSVIHFPPSRQGLGWAGLGCPRLGWE